MIKEKARQQRHSAKCQNIQTRLISGGGLDIGLTFWGKNLTNKEYVARSVDFGQLGFAGTIYGDPRTYGVSLDIEF